MGQNVNENKAMTKVRHCKKEKKKVVIWKDVFERIRFSNQLLSGKSGN